MNAIHKVRSFKSFRAPFIEQVYPTASLSKLGTTYYLTWQLGAPHENRTRILYHEMVAVLTVLTNDAQCGISFCFTADRFDFRNRVLFRRPHFLCRQISDRCSLVVTAQFYLLQKYNSELREQDSNLRPLGYEPSELPNCYHRAILTIQPSR